MMTITMEATIYCEIRDKWGDVESAAYVETGGQANRWFREHNVGFSLVTVTPDGYCYQRKGYGQTLQTDFVPLVPKEPAI